MKKYLLTLLFAFFFVFFQHTNTKAESSGTCIMHQFDKTYEVDVPFYFYEATLVNTVTDSLIQNSNYTHTELHVTDQTKCKSINGKTPIFKKDSGNILNYTNTAYHFSKTKLIDSESIFNSAIFLSPGFISNGDYTIRSEFISLDNSPPIIATENLEPIIISPVGTLINLELLKSKITAYDEIDGILPIDIHEDNYSKNYETLGEFTITFSATDSSKNTAYLNIIIKVIDNKKPTISGQTNIKSYMSNPISIETIKSTLTVKDNYYSLSINNINIIEDNYSNSTNKEGFFTISLNISDPSNNISDTFIVTIENYDDISPTIFGETTYETSSKNKLDLEIIKNQLNIEDNIDKNPSIEISNDTYSLNFHKPGIYQVTYIGKDKNGNISNPHTINITVKDSSKPVFYISKQFIGVDGGFNVTIDQLIDIIEETNNINTNNLISYSIIKDEYTPNKNTPGTYIVELSYEYENNESINVETFIVVDNYNYFTNEKSPKKITFWDSIKKLLLKIWNFIKNIFTFKCLKKSY